MKLHRSSASSPVGSGGTSSRFGRRRFIARSASFAGAAVMEANWHRAVAVSTSHRPVPRSLVPRPSYLETFTDPAFGSRVTRITGDPGTAIPGIGGTWSDVARHHYSKDAAWNCDQSLLCLADHRGRPSLLFLDGASYEPRFGHHHGPGTEMRWHATRPHEMIFVKGSSLGRWNVLKDTVEVIETFAG
jgi:hypothetical protein